MYAVSLLFFLFISCSTPQHKDIIKLRSLVIEKKFEQATALSEKTDFHQKSRSEILIHTEKAMIDHFAGRYAESAKKFEQALILSERQYTRISKGISSFIADDNSNEYYPTFFEQSQIRFFLVLNYFLLAQERDTKDYLRKARAILIEWYTLMDDFRNRVAGKPIFKIDAALFWLGAIIHQQIGTQVDRHIAQNLLINLKEVYFKNYGIYPLFNEKAQIFSQNFNKLHTLPLKEVKERYFAATPLFKNMMNQIDKRLEDINTINFHLFVQNDLIPLKIEKELAALSIATSVPLPSTIKIPYMPEKNTYPEIKIIATNIANQKKIEIIPILVNPLSTIRQREFQQRLPSIQNKAMARYYSKQATSKVAQRVGQNSNKNSTQLAAGLLSIASFISAETDRADLRHWSTLPHQIYLYQAYLPAGQYILTAILPSGQKSLGSITIDSHSSFAQNIFL